MREDDEGFLYPKVDESVCIDCGLCEKVCPVIHQARENRPIVVCAAKNKSEEYAIKALLVASLRL